MSVISTPRWRRVAQDALVCVLVLLLIVLVATNQDSQPESRPTRHRFMKRDGGSTAGIVVGALIFFGLVGFAWISCQHPTWNVCSCCGSCRCCGDEGERILKEEAKKANSQTDVEMGGIDSMLSRFEEDAAEKALSHSRGPSYETRDMRIPQPNGQSRRPSHDRARNKSGHDRNAHGNRGETKRIENWVKDQSHVHAMGPPAHVSPRPSFDAGELQHPRPVQMSHDQRLSVSQLQGTRSTPEAPHGRQLSQSSLKPEHLSTDIHYLRPAHSRSGSAASLPSRSPSPQYAPSHPTPAHLRTPPPDARAVATHVPSQQ